MYQPLDSKVKNMSFDERSRSIILSMSNRRKDKFAIDELATYLDGRSWSGSDAFTMCMLSWEMSLAFKETPGAIQDKARRKFYDSLIPIIEKRHAVAIKYYTRGYCSRPEFTVELDDGSKIRFRESTIGNIIDSNILNLSQLKSIQEMAFCKLRDLFDKNDLTKAEIVYQEIRVKIFEAYNC